MHFTNDDFKIEGSVGGAFGTIGKVIQAPAKGVQKTTTNIGKNVDTTVDAGIRRITDILEIFRWPIIIFIFIIVASVIYKIYDIFFKPSLADQLRETLLMQQQYYMPQQYNIPQ